MYKKDASKKTIKDEHGKPVIEVEGDPKAFLKNKWRQPSLDNAKVRPGSAWGGGSLAKQHRARTPTPATLPCHAEMEGTNALERRQEQNWRNHHR